MAEPTEGTYAIISVGASKAVDVKGANDKSGTNVQTYAYSGTDAQIWAFTKPENNYWQVFCSLTGKCLDIQNGSVKAGTNVRQWSDDNSNAQRWSIQTDGGTWTYSGTSYSTYTIKPSTNSNLSLAVAGNSTANGANIQLASSSTSNFQKWILVPVSALTEAGSYNIVLAADPKMCADISGGSTANSASLIVEALNETSDSQVFNVQVNAQTKLVKLINAKSGKALDVYKASTKAGADVIQYTSADQDNQSWLIYPNGTVSIDGQTTPTYEIRAQIGTNLTMDCQGGGKTAKTNIATWTRNGQINQRFAFVKVERVGNDIPQPAQIDQRTFQRDGYGSITVSGLKFSSTETAFQARYKVRTYTRAKQSYTDTAWKNLADDSTARSGWGDAWTSTFTGTPSGGKISVPFSKSYTLSATNPNIDVIFEIRAYRNSYGSAGIKAHGASRQTTVSLSSRPVLTMSSIEMVDQDGNVALKSEVSNALTQNATLLRGRLVNANGIPISDWVSSPDLYTVHALGGYLYSLPGPGEQVTYEFTLVNTDGTIVTDKFTSTVSYGSSTVTVNPTISYTNDDTGCAFVSSNSHTKDYCYIEIDTLDGIKCMPCPSVSASSGRKWKCAPPLNRDVSVIVVGNTGTSYGVSKKTVRVDSHFSMWNWTDRVAMDYYAECAILAVNESKPPQQTRNYSTDQRYMMPIGRRYPVGFASKNITADMSVEGIAVDEDADYFALVPLPEHAKMFYIKHLLTLSGQGIHPLYRTPYGDWQTVAIEGVDISKKEFGYSNVIVKQSIVED